VLALRLGREIAPNLLFVEEPGHPQIEPERLALYRGRLVQTATLRQFQRDPARVIEDALAARSTHAAFPRVQYAPGSLAALTRELVRQYL
jgi:hypothetical protein